MNYSRCNIIGNSNNLLLSSNCGFHWLENKWHKTDLFTIIILSKFKKTLELCVTVGQPSHPLISIVYVHTPYSCHMSYVSDAQVECPSLNASWKSLLKISKRRCLSFFLPQVLPDLCQLLFLWGNCSGLLWGSGAEGRASAVPCSLSPLHLLCTVPCRWVFIRLSNCSLLYKYALRSHIFFRFCHTVFAYFTWGIKNQKEIKIKAKDK